MGKLIKAIAICEGAGLLGTIFTGPNINTWYVTLNKPPFNPPNWIFGPVWTTLFLFMGVALYRGWTKKINLKWFWIQLVLNVFWSAIFFGAKLPKLAAGEVLLMWAAIAMTMGSFYKKDKISVWLLAPYLGWVSFATILNVAIWILN